MSDVIVLVVVVELKILVQDPVEILNAHLSWLVGRTVPTKVIRVSKKDKPWFIDECRHAFAIMQEAHFRRTHDRS